VKDVWVGGFRNILLILMDCGRLLGTGRRELFAYGCDTGYNVVYHSVQGWKKLNFEAWLRRRNPQGTASLTASVAMATVGIVCACIQVLAVWHTNKLVEVVWRVLHGSKAVQ